MARYFLIVSLFCVFGSVMVFGRAVVSPKKQAELMDYMTRYGYLNRPDPRIGTIVSNDEITTAVKNLQHMAGLKETGSLEDPETVALVDRKRCAVPDFGPTDNARRKRRYATHGTVWHKKHLTYRIVNYMPGITEKEVDETIKKSLDKWSRASQLKFERITDPNKEADIMIKFVKGYHGDNRPTDGPGLELAHAFFPLDNTGLAGDVHFDADEPFAVNSNDSFKVDFNWISLHELGHSLGLDHSLDINSVMFPLYIGRIEDLELAFDDQEGIQQLYGKPHIDRITPTPHTKPSEAPGVPDICRIEKLDTMVMTRDKKTYAFSGAYFWKIGDQGAERAMKIKDHWKGLDDDIDAAVTRTADKMTFFFKGENYWMFRNKRRLRGPTPISDLNLPDDLKNMDAAVAWPGNGRTYFFKGENYWRYNWFTKRVDRGYPRKISKAWLNVPDDLHAALQWKNGKTYFMKGEQYYALKKRGRPRVAVNYPKDIATYWMGCSMEGLEAGKIAPGTSSSLTLLPSILMLIGSYLVSKIL